jgi:hypothetical protein
VPATRAGLSRLLFLQWPLTVLMNQTRQAVRAFKQLYDSDVYDNNTIRGGFVQHTSET